MSTANIPIDVAATMLGVCKQTLRRWDESGQLLSKRAENGYRQYLFGDLQKAMPRDKARPFLKWAGGKTQLLPEILPNLPADYDGYLEPFLGGGALFFALEPAHSKLNDINSDLINCYRQVRDNPEGLADRLDHYQSHHSTEFYYQVRSKSANSLGAIDAAARFIYLNKTCFNGLHRVNKKGEFNVPIGSYKNPRILDINNIFACSKALENTELFSLDYRDFLRQHSKPDALIYMDPPYIPISLNSDFDRYAQGKFRLGNQIELAGQYRKIVDMGAHALLSNSSADLAYHLYGDFKLQTVSANRFINHNANGRGKVEEILVHPKREQVMTFPSTRYMGSKNKLLPHITEILSDSNGGTVLDAFSGSGVVSYHLKKLGFQVTSNDFLTYSSLVTKALIENSEVVLDSDDINMLLKKNRKAKKFIQKTFAGLYFDDEDNKFLDNTLANVELLICPYKKALALSALSRACLKRRPRGIFTYVGFRYDDGRKDLKHTIQEHFLFSVSDFNNAVFSNGESNISINSCALELKKSSPDIVYLDPPYYSKHSDNDYVRRYHFIEGLCKNWEGLEIQEHTKTKKFRRYPSPFDTRDGAYSAFEKIIGQYQSSKILISYSSNSLPAKDEITSMLEAVGKEVQLFEIDYKYSFGNQGHKVSENNNTVKEYLFYAQ